VRAADERRENPFGPALDLAVADSKPLEREELRHHEARWPVVASDVTPAASEKKNSLFEPAVKP
jgi:hypothetical protein